MRGRHVAGIDICLWCIFCIPISFGSALTQLTTASPWQFISHYRARAAQKLETAESFLLTQTVSHGWSVLDVISKAMPKLTIDDVSCWKCGMNASNLCRWGTNKVAACSFELECFWAACQILEVDVAGKRIFMRVDFNVPQESVVVVANRWALSSPLGCHDLTHLRAFLGRTRPTLPRSPTLSELMVLCPPSRRPGWTIHFMKGQDGNQE